MQTDFLSNLRRAFPALKLLEAEPLSGHTTFRIGGPAPMAFPSDAGVMAAVYRFCLERGVRPLILGAGSNVLAPDSGLTLIDAPGINASVGDDLRVEDVLRTL